MPFVKLLSREAIQKLSDEFGYREPPPHQPEPPAIERVPMRVAWTKDDYPHMSCRPAWKKRLALLEAQNYRCAYCGITVISTGPDGHHQFATVDHVIARIHGGLPIWSNEVIACALCNGGRGQLDAMEYFAQVQAVGRWEAFRWGCLMESMRHYNAFGRVRKRKFKARQWIDKQQALAART